MITKAAAANGMTREEAKYSAWIDRDLAAIEAIQKEMARDRGRGRKVTAGIDRSLKEIQVIIDRVQATL